MPPWRITDRGAKKVRIVESLKNVHALAPPDGRERRCAIRKALGGVTCPRGRRLKALLTKLLGLAIPLVGLPRLHGLAFACRYELRLGVTSRGARFKPMVSKTHLRDDIPVTIELEGKLRPLGISTVRDRVCMTAAMLVLEPIFEADFPSEIYAYRAGRNAQQAVVEVEELLFRGHPDVVDADLADYFGSIPHTDLLKSVARRIVDRRVVHLIKMWLDCPVEEIDQRGRKKRTTEARDNRRGIPQGSPLSPLLAKSLHAPVCAGVEEARPRAKSRHSPRHLCGRSRDPVSEGQR